MAKGYNATEYMFSSARIRSLEVKLAGREQISRLVDAESASAAVAALGEFGFEPQYDAGGRLLREDMLMAVLKSGFDVLEEMECASAVRFLRYQYDCNNVKAIIKCAAGGREVDGMLLRLGSVSVEDAKATFVSKDYSCFPKNMAAAIAEAEEAFASTGDPQKIDLIIDRATFADMLEAAVAGGVGLARELVIARIDLVNITMAVRLIRMKLGNRTAAVLDEAYIEGGNLAKEALAVAVTEGESALSELLLYGGYRVLAELIGAGASLGELEKQSDDIWMGVAKQARYLPFGAEIAIGYIAALEYEIKNIRIILAGKDAGLAPDVIRERLRESYV